MTLSVSLSPIAEAKLNERAAAQGKDPTAYASDLLEKAVTRPGLVELLAASQAEFAKSGKTRDQVMDMGRRVVERVRAAKGK